MLILISDKIYEYVKVQRESDGLVWIHIRGKSISLPYVINVGIIYIPPEGSPYAVADDFENICESIRNKSKTGPVFICGDTNSRTSDIPDYAPCMSAKTCRIWLVMSTEPWTVTAEDL